MSADYRNCCAGSDNKLSGPASAELSSKSLVQEGQTSKPTVQSPTRQRPEEASEHLQGQIAEDYSIQD